MKKVLFSLAFVHCDNVLLLEEQSQKLLEQKTKTDTSFFNYYGLSFNIVSSSLKTYRQNEATNSNTENKHDAKIGLQLALDIANIIQIDCIALGEVNFNLTAFDKKILDDLGLVLNLKFNIKNIALKILPTWNKYSLLIPKISINLHPMSYIASELRIFNETIFGEEKNSNNTNFVVATKTVKSDLFGWKKYTTDPRKPIALTSIVSISVGYNLAPRLLSFIILKVTPSSVSWLVNMIANIFLLNSLYSYTVGQIVDTTSKTISQMIFFTYTVGYSFQYNEYLTYVKPYESLLSNLVSPRNYTLFSLR